MEKRNKFRMEFMVRATPTMIFSMISNAPGLSRWFAEVEANEDQIYTFNWLGSSEKAQLERVQKNKFVRFKWLDRADNEYLTIEISRDELTDDVALIITDFDKESEIEEAKKAWEASIEELKSSIGAQH